MHRIVPYDTRSGEPLRAFIDTSDWDFTESVTSPGRGNIRLPLRELKYGLAMNQRLVSGWETTYAVESNEAPAFIRTWSVDYAGVVVDYTFDDETGVASIQTLEIDTILSLRPLWGTHGDTDSLFEISGQTLGDVIREVLWYAIGAERNDARWPLPVDLGALRHGEISRPEWRYHFRSAATIIDELTSEDGSPDWLLRPYLVAGRLRWKLELGDPYLQSDPIRLPVASPGSRVQSQVTGLSIRHEFQSERTGVNVIGAGSEVDMRWGTAGTGQVPEARSSIPPLIGIASHKNVDNTSQLDSLARATLRAAAGGTEQWSFTVKTAWGDRIKPGMIRAGSTLILDHPGNELVRAGRYVFYVLSVRVKPDNTYRVEAQRR